MNGQLITTASLTILTLLAAMASVLALAWLMFPKLGRRWHVALNVLLPVIALGTTALFTYRLAFIHHSWVPLESHVDGLILINVIVALMMCFLQTRKRMGNINAFVLPIFTFLMAWAICASYWTFQAFPIGYIWQTVHRLGVYLGSVFYLVAACAGVMFLYVRRQLKFKRSSTGLDRLPSLEAVEHLMVMTATLGFALISLGLVSGFIIITSGHSGFANNWWYTPKVILATLAWLVYAVVMNVRYTKSFRGARAAWLSIIGLLLVLLTFVAALVMAEHANDTANLQANEQIVMTQPAPGSFARGNATIQESFSGITPGTTLGITPGTLLGQPSILTMEGQG